MTWLPPSNTDDTVSDQIFSMVKVYLDEAANAGGCSSNAPDAPIVPVAEFSSSLDMPLPSAEQYVNHVVPSDGVIDPYVAAPAYADTYEDIASIALSDVSAAIYGDYVLPEGLPDHDIGDPDLAYPEAGYVTVQRYAGLDPNIEIPDIIVGTVPTFLAIPDVTHELSDIEKFVGEVPLPPTLGELTLLEQPTKLDPNFSPELMAAIDKGLDGTEILPANIQQIMLDRGLQEIEDGFDGAERKAFDKSASAGFFSTNGPLVHALSELAHDASFEDRKVHEAMRSEVYKRGLAQLQSAISAGLALEAMNGAVHLDYAAKLVDTLKFNVAMQIEYANLLVSSFNEQMRAVRLVMDAYQRYISTKTLDYRAYTKALLSDTAVLVTNEAKVTAYAAQVGTIAAQADSYSVQVKYNTQEIEEFQTYVAGILKNVSIARTNIEAFSQSTKAYKQAVKVDTAKIEGYAAQVRATGSATGVYEANYDSYAAAQGARRSNDEARQGWYSSSLRALSGEIQEFQSAAQAQREYLQTLTSWSQGNATMHGQYAAGVGAKSTYTKVFNRHSVSLSESQANIDLANEDARVRMEALNAQAIAVQESINIGLKSAEATTASGCAQAAYSVRSISAGMRATAGMTDSGAATVSTARNTQTQRSYAYRKTRSIST